MDEFARLKELAAACALPGLDHLPVVSRENATPFAADLTALLSRLERAEAENEQLRLAICGGEDAPGYAASLPLASILDVAKQNTRSWFAETDRATLAESNLARAVEGLRPFAGVAPEFDGWKTRGSTTTENDIRLSYGKVRITYDHFRTAAALLSELSPPNTEASGYVQDLTEPRPAQATGEYRWPVPNTEGEG